jgi:subtilisin family serine protease
MRRRLIAPLHLCALLLLVSCAQADSAASSAAQRAVWVMLDPASSMATTAPGIATTAPGSATTAPVTARPAISDYTIRRRAQRGIGTFPNDAPIPQELIRQIESTGAHVRETSRWLRAVSVDASPDALRRIKKLRSVAYTRDVGSLMKAGGSASGAVDTITHVMTTREFALDSAYYGRNWPGIRQLGIPPAHLAGYDGTGVRIAIFDTGFEPNHVALQSRTVFAKRDFINNDGIVADEPADTSLDAEVHGTAVWSIMGALQPGLIVGPAFGASFALAKVDAEPLDTHLDEDRWVAAMEWSDSLGVDIINSSVTFRDAFADRGALPYDSLDGDSYIVTRAADEAARRSILVVVAMGDAATTNEGTLNAPADADSVIAVGSVDRFGNAGVFFPGFTARGPTFDRRIKPELVALGTSLVAADSKTQVGTLQNLAGTSFSTPLITGIAAMFMQAYPGSDAMAVRRALQLSGDRATHPDNTFGWGVPDVGAAILFPQGIALNRVDPTDLAGALTSIVPTFSWNIPETNLRMHPVLYRVEVATDTGFTNLVFTDTVREGLSLIARRPLQPANRLFWRVVGTTQSGVSRASLPDAFRVPDWVRLLTFADNEPSFSTTTQPELSWLPLEARTAGPFTYEVQIIAHGTGVIVQDIRNLTSSVLRVPLPLTPNESFRWRVIARARTGEVDTVASMQPFVISTDDKPPATILYQNFPNPFPNSTLGVSETSIWFDLAKGGPVNLVITDTRGNMVKHLIPGRGCTTVTLPAGIYGRTGASIGTDPCVQTSWDGRGDDGRIMPAGIYILRLHAPGAPELSKKILFNPGRN